MQKECFSKHRFRSFDELDDEHEMCKRTIFQAPAKARSQRWKYSNSRPADGAEASEIDRFVAEDARKIGHNDFAVTVARLSFQEGG